MSIDRWMDEEDVAHVYSGILLSHKKEWNITICSNMNGPRDDHTKWNKSDRARQTPYDITYMWNLKKWYEWTYLQNRNTLTDLEKNLWLPKGKSWWRGYTGSLGLADTHCYIYKIDKDLL